MRYYITTQAKYQIETSNSSIPSEYCYCTTILARIQPFFLDNVEYANAHQIISSDAQMGIELNGNK